MARAVHAAVEAALSGQNKQDKLRAQVNHGFNQVRLVVRTPPDSNTGSLHESFMLQVHDMECSFPSSLRTLDIQHLPVLAAHAAMTASKEQMEPTD